VLAGAWTDTGWPDTMEGAVRSGQDAAAELIRQLGAPAVVGRRATAVLAGSEPAGFEVDGSEQAAQGLPGPSAAPARQEAAELEAAGPRAAGQTGPGAAQPTGPGAAEPTGPGAAEPTGARTAQPTGARDAEPSAAEPDGPELARPGLPQSGAAR
jgi:hypothetical protein